MNEDQPQTLLRPPETAAERLELGTPIASGLSPLVVAAQGGDLEATDQILSELTPKVLRAVRALCGPQNPALEDIVQEVLIDVVNALPSFRGESTLVHFAIRIAARKAIKQKRRVRAVQGWLETLEQTEAAHGHTALLPSDQTLSEQRRTLLFDLVQQLPENQAEAMILRVVLGFSLDEIAALMAAPQNTIRSRLRLAKEALRERIEANPSWRELCTERA